MSTAELKAIEDRWDALLCALAVALEFLEHDVMTFYQPADWTAGAILAPVLREPSGVSTSAPAGREGRGSPGRAPDEAGADHQLCVQRKLTCSAGDKPAGVRARAP